jgi:hypoxanthine phosphoribosyltransferase
MLESAKAWEILNSADEVCSAQTVAEAVRGMAQAITRRLEQSNPLILSVMGGAVVFTGQLLPLLRFPLDFDTIAVSRYRERTQGGDIEWRTTPKEDLKGRVVLVLDDILDEGRTLASVRDKVLALGAAQFFAAVLVEKEIGRDKPIRADFVGLTAPNRYVFGYGMDVYGAWRNLPAIYALQDPSSL